MSSTINTEPAQSLQNTILRGKYLPYPAEPISDVRDMFLKSTRKYAHRTALQYKRGGRWNQITFAELHSLVEQTACGLAALGLKPMSREELEREIDKILSEEAALVREKGDAAFSPLMGRVMAMARGRADGETVSRLLRQKLKRALRD